MLLPTGTSSPADRALMLLALDGLTYRGIAEITGLTEKLRMGVNSRRAQYPTRIPTNAPG